MNPREKLSYTAQQGQERADGRIELSPEAQAGLEQLRKELRELKDLMALSMTRKLAFDAPEGEHEIGKRMVALQKEEIPKIFKDTNFETSYLRTHNTQREQYSCSIATATNILKALGISVTETEVSQMIGKSGQLANIWPEEISDYLKSKELEVSRVENILEAITALIKGGKIILPLLPPKYLPPHSVAITGIKIEKGNIQFYLNDPQYKNYAERIPLNDLVDAIMPYSFNVLTPAYTVFRNISEKN